MRSLKKVMLVILILGYLYGGINHFVNPVSYVRIIPAYIPYPNLMNILAGATEIAFSLLLIFYRTRPLAAWGIILMLGAFLPVHIQMVIGAPLKVGSLTVTPLIAWARLLLQPVLMLWAWWYTKPFKFVTS